MLRAFVFNETAVIVRHWFEVGADDNEHGARLELRLLTKQSQRGPLSAPQKIEIDGIFWRADLFDRIGDVAGNFSRAHFHSDFDGIDPTGRDWDHELTNDPFGWTERELSDIAKLAVDAGVSLSDPEHEAMDIRCHLPEIMAAARSCGPTECPSPSSCLAETRDTRELVLMMLSERREEQTHAQDPRLIST